MFKKLLLAALVAAPLCLSAQTLKFGTINSQEIFNIMPEKATAETALKAKADELDKTLKALQAEGQKKYDEFQKLTEQKAEESVLEAKYNELNELDMKIRNFQQQAQNEIQNEQEKLLAPISQKLSDAIKAVGAEGGYTFIYDLSYPFVVYSNPLNGAEDITAKVKARLGIK